MEHYTHRADWLFRRTWDTVLIKLTDSCDGRGTLLTKLIDYFDKRVTLIVGDCTYQADRLLRWTCDTDCWTLYSPS